MVETSLTDEIITLVNAEANNNPAPTLCTIVKVYSDNIHADIETDVGIIDYVETISNNLGVGHKGIVIYLDGDLDSPIVVTK